MAEEINTVPEAEGQSAPAAKSKADSGAVVTEEQAREWAAKAAAEGKPRLRILTGDRTTGKLHLGHYVGSLKHRVAYQSLYDTFILMADVQALTTHYDRPEILKESVREVALDYMAAGIDPEQATIVVQSMVPAIAELTVYYGLLIPVSVLQNNPTTKAEAELQGFSIDGSESKILNSFPEEYHSKLEAIAVNALALISREHKQISKYSPNNVLNALRGLQKTRDKVMADELRYQLELQDYDKEWEEFLADVPSMEELEEQSYLPQPPKLPAHRKVYEQELNKFGRIVVAVMKSKMLERHVVDTLIGAQ